MKLSSKFARLFVLVSGLVIAAAGQAAAQEQVLLVVDDSDPAAVTFTATSGTASASDSGHTFYDGVDLAGFYASARGIENSFSTSTLTTASDLTPLYDTGAANNLSGSDVGFNIYTAAGQENSPTQTFVEGSRAFIGEATIDLTETDLPAAGTVGFIYAGYEEDEGAAGVPNPTVPSIEVLIGTYVVVPEPHTTVLLLVASAGLLLTVRRKLA